MTEPKPIDLQIQISVPAYSQMLEDQQERFTHFAVSVIEDSFITMAIKDYAACRLLVQNKLEHQFYWSAAQSLEKILKAILLLNGRPLVQLKEDGSQVHRYGGGHDLIKLYRAAKQYMPGHQNLNFRPGDELSSLFETFVQLKPARWDNVTMETFLHRINFMGSTTNRYDTYGIDYLPSDLFILDQVIHSLCQYVPGELMNKEQVRQKAGQSVGETCFYNLNFPYAPAEFQHDTTGMKLASVSTTTLKFNFGPGPYTPDSPVLYKQWLKANIFMPETVFENIATGRINTLRLTD